MSGGRQNMAQATSKVELHSSAQSGKSNKAGTIDQLAFDETTIVRAKNKRFPKRRKRNETCDENRCEQEYLRAWRVCTTFVESGPQRF
ncbi:hypothetical protein M413DRAFT_318976 [Hebeloma cylindrosporum]|uniref:Uncharacterized protein n=1 Tax=Hebeloma cylindrosporum TaxID=76867 RepID=A0A0C3BHN5_HEBCY|nr:hypothetical protein M413DRAFT_318976 [Hebeloma cylindrosporum h7]